MANQATLSKGCDNVAYPKSKIIKSGWYDMIQNQIHIPSTFIYCF